MEVLALLVLYSSNGLATEKMSWSDCVQIQAQFERDWSFQKARCYKLTEATEGN